ncbi:MAG: hypothetical protein EOO80_10245, partial [Oxalobacteraceae bacterium]
MKNAIYSAVAALMVLSASAAHAVTITYDYAMPSDGSGKTSQLAGTANQSTGNVFVETFDRANGTGGQTLSPSQLTITPI